MEALNVRALVKRYGSHAALAGVNFSVPRGQWVALLGPNGAGKSTLFQVLTGLFMADEGEVEVAGYSLRNQATRALGHLGVVFQQTALDMDLSLRRNLQFHADLHGLPAAHARSRMEALTTAIGIDLADVRPVRALSGGNRRKVELARALLHAPQVLLMDEPTVGLDPQSRRDLLLAIRQAVDHDGVSVLWATHLVEEAVACDRVLVLHQGRILADGPPDSVAQGLGGPTLEAAFIRATRSTTRAEAEGRSPAQATPPLESR
jgi:ABC-2 type transport system ATP-binding protein